MPYLDEQVKALSLRHRNIYELVEALSSRRLILFVGSGVSQNLGLPSWEALIDQIAEKEGYDARVFKQLGDFYSLAEFYWIRKRKQIGSLRSWMDINWHPPSIKIEASNIHRLILKLDCPIIYTTNYDRWIEKAYEYYNKPYAKITDVRNIAQITERITQIVKFHGDFDDDRSITLAESSYFERLDFSRPLDIKLKSDLLGKGVLFIGYSLTDINVRFLFYQIHKMWDESEFKDVRPKSYFFLSKPNAVVKEILSHRGITAIGNEEDMPEESLEEFLQTIVDAFPE